MSTMSSPRSALCSSTHRNIYRRRLTPSLVVRCAAGGVGGVGSNGSGSLPGHTPAPQPRNVCGVFQLDGQGPSIDLIDVRDACEACSTASTPHERRQCFEVYGLDADKVDRYYDRVVQMERLIDQGDSMAQSLVTSGGALMLYFMAYCILKV